MPPRNWPAVGPLTPALGGSSSNQVSNPSSPYQFSMAISSNYHQERQDTHIVEGLTPDADARSGIEEP